MIIISDATVWKFESRFGFRYFLYRGLGFGFRFSKKKIYIYIYIYLKMENRNSGFGFWLRFGSKNWVSVPTTT